MKGFFRWFKANTKIKRWLFLILIGIILYTISINPTTNITAIFAKNPKSSCLFVKISAIP